MRKNDKYAGYVVCRIKLKDGKIASMDEHWADDGEAPKWRQDMNCLLYTSPSPRD